MGSKMGRTTPELKDWFEKNGWVWLRVSTYIDIQKQQTTKNEYWMSPTGTIIKTFAVNGDVRKTEVVLSSPYTTFPAAPDED